MKTFATLATSAVVLVIGALVGFQLLTASADTTVDNTTCEDRTVAKGEPVTSNLVQVNVFNASERSGLANRVTINLQRKGFLGGKVANNESAVKTRAVTILTTDKDDPRVRLVAQQFRDKVEYAEPDIALEDGVTVIVGDSYDTKNGIDDDAGTEVKSDRELTVCILTAPLP